MTDRKGDDWGVGEKADGSIDVMSPEEAARRIAQRDAEEAAFAEVADHGQAEPVPVDLDALGDQELDELIAGLDQDRPVPGPDADAG